MGTVLVVTLVILGTMGTVLVVTLVILNACEGSPLLHYYSTVCMILKHKSVSMVSGDKKTGTKKHIPRF